MGCCPIFAVRYQKYETVLHKIVQRCIALRAFTFAGLALQSMAWLFSVLLGFAEKSAQNCNGMRIFRFFHMFYLCGTGVQSHSGC